MKLLPILAWCLICASLSLAQNEADQHLPPGVVILKLEWSKESPFFHSDGPDASSRGGSAAGAKMPPSAGRAHAPPPSKPYNYSMKFRNDGAKAIKAVAWEYLFLDPVTKKEEGKHRFNSYQKVGSNKNATLEAKSASPPSHVVSIGGLGKNQRSPFLEKAVIKCVLYSDGTEWKHPESKGNECEDLRRGKKRGTSSGRN